MHNYVGYNALFNNYTDKHVQWCGQSFEVGKGQSAAGPLIALIVYLNVLLEYLDISNFHWQGTFG